MRSLEQTGQLLQLLNAAGVHPESDFGRMAQAAALSGNPRHLAKIVRLLERQVQQKLLDQRLFALPKEDIGQGLLLGQATDGLQLGGMVRVDPRKHVLVTGTTGSGKSYVNTFLLAQYLQLGRGVRAWIFDLEREFGCLTEHFSRQQLWWMRMPWLFVNPLRPPQGVDLQTWMIQLVSLLRAIYFMRDGGASLARSTLQELYERHGSFRGSEQWPLIGEWLHLLRSKKFAVTSQFQGHLETLTRVVMTLVDLFPLVEPGKEMPLETLTERSVIFDVAGMTSQDIEFLICLLLHVPEASRQAMPRLVLIEECQVMLNPQRAVRSDLGESPLQDAIRRQRKAARSFILTSQGVGEMPGSVIGNVGTVITFGLRNLKCQQVLGAAMGLANDQKTALVQLPPRVMICHTSSFPEPLMVQIPELAFKQALPEEVIEREMRQELAAWWPVLSVEKQTSAENAEAGRDAVSSVQSEATTGESVQTVVGLEKPQVSLAALKYLELLNKEEHHLLPVTQFDKTCGFGLAEGHAVRAGLEREQLIEVRPIRTGARGAGVKVVTLSDKGFEMLENLGIRACRPRGKGAWVSQFWAYRIKEWVRERHPGADVVIEGRRKEKAADVAVCVDGRWIAYEVQLSEKHVTENVVKDLLAGFDEVVLCVLTERERKEVERRVALGETFFEKKDALARVRCVLLRSFLSVGEKGEV